MVKKKEEQHRPDPFDQLMFGNRPTNSPTPKRTEDDNNEQDSSLDLYGTAQTMMETYKQLSPYFKGVSDMIKKYKK